MTIISFDSFANDRKRAWPDPSAAGELAAYGQIVCLISTIFEKRTGLLTIISGSSCFLATIQER